MKGFQILQAANSVVASSKNYSYAVYDETVLDDVDAVVAEPKGIDSCEGGF